MDKQNTNDIVVSAQTPAPPPAHSGAPYGYGPRGYGYGYGYGAGAGSADGNILSGFRFDPVEAFKRLWFVVLLFVVLGAAVAIFVLPNFVAPEYEAETTIQVKAEVPAAVGETATLSNYSMVMGTHVARMRSDRNLLNTLNDESVRELPWVSNTTAMHALEHARKHLSVSHIRDTELIEVAFRDNDPVAAKIFVEALVKSYLAIVRDEEAENQRTLQARLEENRENLRQVIDMATKTIRQMNSELGSTDLDTYQETLLEQITNAENILIDQRVKRDMARMKLKRKLEESDAGESGKNAIGTDEAAEVQGIVTKAIESDPTLMRMRDSLAEVQDEYDQEMIRRPDQKGGLTPKLKGLKRRIAQLNDRIAAREEELRDTLTKRYTELIANSQRRELEDIIEQADITEKTQTAFLEQKRKELQEVSEKQQTVAQLKEERARHQADFETVVARLQEMKLNEGGRFTERYKWDGVVALPTTPVPDKLNKLRLLVILGCAALGSMIVILIVGFDTRLKRVADLRVLGPVDVLGVLPRLQDLARKSGVEHVGEHLSEEFRMVRTRLLHMPGFEEKHALMIASPTPGSGKTTVSVNLAALIAQAGRKVLLVDGDLRKPDVHRVLDIPLNIGLSDVLEGKCKLDDAIVPVSPGLDVLTAGSPVPKPSELLSRRNVKKSVDSWSETYDLVIFDTSPLLPVSDGRVLAGVCDSAVLVVRADQADRRELSETMGILDSTPVQMLGVVLNGVRIKHAGGSKSKGYYSYRDAYRGRYSDRTSETASEKLPQDVTGKSLIDDEFTDATPEPLQSQSVDKIKE